MKTRTLVALLLVAACQVPLRDANAQAQNALSESSRR